MENRRDPDQLENVQPVVSSQPGQPETQPFTSQKLLQLLESRPMLFWGGLWASLFLVTIVSISSILSPGVSNEVAASGAAIGSTTSAAAPPIRQTGQKERFPLWLFGAVALSCTAGSLLISKQLNRPQPRRIVRRATAGRATAGRSAPQSVSLRKRQKRMQSRPPVGVSPQVAQSQVAQTQVAQSQVTQSQVAQRPPATVNPVSHPRPVPEPAPARVLPPLPPYLLPQGSQRQGSQRGDRKPTSSPQAPVLPTTTPTQPTKAAAVTVVPDHEHHPLDWGNASLADSLDLRKQRSLSSWLET